MGALKICLDEIERCRPFFVCLLGSRYGWVPPPEEVPRERFENAVRGAPLIAIADWYTLDETSAPPVYRLRRDRPIPEDLAETLARFWEDAYLPNAGESITAREILRGVFEEGFPATHALFYLRKPGVHTGPAFPRAFVPVFVEQDAKHRAKLGNLETKIRECADRMVVRDYDAGFAGLQINPSLLPAALSDEERKGFEDGAVTADELDRFSAAVREAIVRWGTVALSGLETLGNQILEDLWAVIEKELERPVAVLDGHQRERAYHERFVVDRTRLFLGRGEIVKRVLDVLADPTGGDLIVAVSGSGGPFGSGDNALRVWDLETGHSRVLNGHTGWAEAVAVTPDGRCAVSGSRDKTLRVWDLQTGGLLAIHLSPGGAVFSAAQKFPLVVAGTVSGRVDILHLRQLPLAGPRVITVVRLWLCASGVGAGRWDDTLTATCDACGQRFPASAAMLDTVAAITRTARLGPEDSPSLGLPVEAWAEARLLSECPLCHEPLKFNPFVVDNRDRYLPP